MTLAELSSPEAVVAAIKEYDQLGRGQFLKKYGFGAATQYMVVYQDRVYDPKAIAGAAYAHQFPEQELLTPDDFSGGITSGAVGPKLESLGFKVVDTGELSPAIARALVDIRDGNRPYDTPTGIDGPDLEALRSRDLIVDVDGDPDNVTLSSAGNEALAAILSGPQTKQAWLFQANPRYYDIESAVSELDEMNWGVNSFHADAIHPGERAYIWESGPDKGGVIAVGTVLSEPTMMAEQEGGQFIRDPTKFEGEQLRVRLRIDSVLDPILRRADLKDHPVLNGLKVIQLPRGTTYRVSPQQDRALQEMITGVTDLLAASVQKFRAEYPYNDESINEDAAQGLELAAQWRPALSAEALESPDWDTIASLFRSKYHGNLGPAKSAPLHLIKSGTSEDRERLADAIRSLLHGEGDLAVRLQRFLTADLAGIKETVAMKLLSVSEPAKVLHIFKVHGWNGKEELMVLPPVSLAVPEADTPAELAIRTNDLLRARLAPYFGDDCFGMTRYLYWLGGRAPDDADDGIEGEGLDELAAELFLDDAGWLEDAVDLLKRKRQLIFYGPPGTGKTYISLKLMKHLAPQQERREIVQFHPSYSYEDFVRGYRPVDDEGHLAYEVISGPLLRLAKRARKALASGDDEPYILLIDEINRGNLPRILGELLYLLEYRSDEDGVQLMYGDEDEEKFTLPANLWIIGTMNTADRSIGLIDAALRRRFHFKALFPGDPPIIGTLHSWLEANGLNEIADQAAGLVDKLNDRLTEHQGSYGENLKVGHSYFMEKDLDPDLLSRIWASDVLPYLEEQLFGRDVDVKANFSLEALESESSQPDAEGEDGDGVPGEPAGLLDESGAS